MNEVSDVFVSGFSIVRNAVRYRYPVEAALRSIAPLCDEIIVNAGDSDDETLEVVRGIGDPKIRVFESVWGDEVTVGNLMHSLQTNLALDRCRGTWCFYIQADEVLHEDDVSEARAAMEQHAEDPRVEALVFDYLHFYGSFDWIGTGRRWYRREVRIVKKATGIRSVAGAQGFRVDGRKPRAVLSGARIFHYGWAKRPEVAGQKVLQWYRFRRDPEWQKRTRYSFRRIPGLRRFEGSHPGVMRGWIERDRWDFEPRDYPRDWSWKSVKAILSDAVERASGWRPFEHRNYVRVG
ncbi:MAG: glycosyltransferase [Gemmatimonadetes bacterium]|nr:glycosyltransferase [Gemmatimonadota bacterium]